MIHSNLHIQSIDGCPCDSQLRSYCHCRQEAEICRPDKGLLLSMIGTPECNMGNGAVCASKNPPDPGEQCTGRLVNGLDQLDPSTGSQQHQWVNSAHQLGLLVHVWTIRNEVRQCCFCFMVYSQRCMLTAIAHAMQPCCGDRFYRIIHRAESISCLGLCWLVE